MLLVDNQLGNIDMYQYRLILAIACSRYDLAEEFEYLVMTPFDEIEKLYITYNMCKPEDSMEIFRFYLKDFRKIKNADEIIYSTYRDLFSMHVNEILPCLFETYHMDLKVHDMLQNELKRKISDASWQLLKGDVIQVLKDGIKLRTKFYGKGTNLFGIINSTLAFYHRREKRNIHLLLNKTGINKAAEEEFNLSSLNIETIPTKKEVSINFSEVMKSIYILNTDLYLHRAGNTMPFYFYDVLSYYKSLYMQRMEEKIKSLFASVFKRKESTYVGISEPVDERNSGISEKLRKHRMLLAELQPIVEFGLKPEEVNEYVRKIYVHVVKNHSGNASSLFTIKPTSKVGHYGTLTTFSKLSGHEKIKDVLEGMVALNHLMVYISAKRINIFDIPSEVFLRQEFLYRFDSLEEVIDLFKPINEIFLREEDSNVEKLCNENRMPLNDNVIDVIKNTECEDFSLEAVDVIPYLGFVPNTKNGKKVSVSTKNKIIFNKFYSALVEMDKAKKCIEQIKLNLNFSSIKCSISFLDFALNMSFEYDILSSFNIDFLKKKGITADLACVREDTGYYKIPDKPFLHYCYNSKEVSAALSSLHSQSTDSYDAILEVYRVCSFAISFWRILKLGYDDLRSFCNTFSSASDLTMGFFDAYGFTSQNLFLCSIPSMTPNEAIKKITNMSGTNLFMTGRIGLNSIYTQLENMYNLFFACFKKSFLLLEQLADTYYYNLANKIGGGYSLTGNESFLKGARRVILDENCMYTGEHFTRFAARCTRTVDGYLKYHGKLVTKLKKGKSMVLHEYGLWVGMQDDGNYFIDQAMDDFLDGGFV